MLAKQHRLVKKKDFAETFKRGKSFYIRFFGVKAVPAKASHNRYGIIISTKVSKKSVERNKLKRQIRAILKELDKQLVSGYDMAIVVLPTALNQDFFSLKDELAKIFSKLKLFKQNK
jgi:ribonuclease P protein component